MSVRERKSKPITVVGAVPHPMVYQAERPVTLLEVLAEAGGVAIDAGDTAIVTRPGSPDQRESSEAPAMSNEDVIPTPAADSRRRVMPAVCIARIRHAARLPRRFRCASGESLASCPVSHR